MDKTEVSDFENNNTQETYTNPQDKQRRITKEQREARKKRQRDTEKYNSAIQIKFPT